MGWNNPGAYGINQVASAQVTAAGNTDVYSAPTTSNYMALTGYCIEVTNDATLAVAGILTIKFANAVIGVPVQFIEHQLYLPAAAPSPIPSGNWSTGWVVFPLPGIVTPIITGNRTVRVNLSAALVTGSCNVIMAGVNF